MSVVGRLSAALKAFGNGWYRYESHKVLSWEQREAAEQQALADLRVHPGFAVVQDIFDEEVRQTFEAFCQEQDDTKALRLHAKATAISRMVSLLNGAMSAKERQEHLQRQVDLLTVDRARQVDRQVRAQKRAMTAAHP